MKIKSLIILIVTILFLKKINSAFVYPRPSELTPIKLKPIISIGNFCPYKNYGVQITINKINYNLVIDTLNSVTTLSSKECRYGCLRLPRLYIPSSKTKVDKEISKGYYKDSTVWQGYVVGEKIIINHNLTTKSEIKMIALTSQSKPPANPICESSSMLAHGIIGVGQSKEINSFVRQFSGMNNIPPIFSLTMCPENPRIWFGGYDPSVLEEPKKFAFTRSEGDSYGFTINNVYIGPNTLYQVTDFVWKSELDTSTPFIHLPSSVFHQAIQVLSRERHFNKYFNTRFFTEKKCVLNPLANFTIDQINGLLPKFRIVFKSNLPNSEISLDAVPSYLVIEGDKACPGIVESLDYNSRFGVSLFQQYMVLFDQVNGLVAMGRASCKPNRWVPGSNWGECKRDLNSTDIRVGGINCEMQTRPLKCINGRNKRVADSLCHGIFKPLYKRPCYKEEESSEHHNDNSSSSHRPSIFVDNDDDDQNENSPPPTTSTKNGKKITPKPVRTKKPTTDCKVDIGTWKVMGNWSDCDQICGSGLQIREVLCISINGELLDQERCNSHTKPPSERVCAVAKCQAEYHWDTSDWSGCSTQCGEGTQSRFSTCIDSSVWRNVDSLNCKGPMPILERECLGQPLCSKFKWDWEPCQPSCPEMAYVYCYNSSSATKVDNSFCKQIPNLFIPIDCKCYKTKKHLQTTSTSEFSDSTSNSSKLILPLISLNIIYSILILFITIKLI
ncbi:hypothetical protein ACTFIR_008489 [Dictyostelium discoideum]